MAMRILIAARRYGPLVGGAEVLLQRFAAALAGLRHHVTVVTQRWDPQHPAHETDRNVTVERIGVPQARLVGTYLYVRRLRRWIRRRRNDFDLCYTSMLKHTAYATCQACGPIGMPVVLRPEGSGRGADTHWQRQALFGGRIARACRQADAFVALSPAVHGELAEAEYPKDRIVDIPNGVPVPGPLDLKQRFDWRRKLGLAEGPTVVYTGRLAHEKGLGTLVQAWGDVVRRVPDAQLVLVGDGPQAGVLREWIGEAKLESHCRLTGQVADVDAYLRAASAFVLPSLDEGMSVALLEAMAVGLPVVASDVPGNRRLVEPGKTGWLAPVDRPEALAEALVRVLSDRDEAGRRGTRAREAVVQRWSMDRMAKEHVALFERILRGEACHVD